jgi:hypothetical protein
MTTLTVAGPTMTLSLLDRSGKVPEKSGLNWWNGGGRNRHVDEAYIRLPKAMKDQAAQVFGSNTAGTKFHAYLAATDEWIELQLEGVADEATQLAKQISSARNKRDLGRWFLRDRLGLPARALVTLQGLQAHGRTDVTFTRIGTDPKTGWAQVRVDF